MSHPSGGEGLLHIWLSSRIQTNLGTKKQTTNTLLYTRKEITHSHTKKQKKRTASVDFHTSPL